MNKSGNARGTTAAVLEHMQKQEPVRPGPSRVLQCCGLPFAEVDSHAETDITSCKMMVPGQSWLSWGP